MQLISDTYIKIKEQIVLCNNAKDACRIAIEVFDKQIIESIENNNKSFSNDEIESLFFLSCLGAFDKVVIDKIKLNKYIAMKFVVDSDEFLFEFKKARAKNKKSLVVDLEQRTINGMLCVISTTMNEYIKSIKN